jgi:hypothetical protein
MCKTLRLLTHKLSSIYLKNSRFHHKTSFESCVLNFWPLIEQYFHLNVRKNYFSILEVNVL